MEESELLKLIDSLREIRKVPQFFYCFPISISGSIKVREAILTFKEDHSDNDYSEIDFIINSGGGIADDAYRIIRTLRKNFKIVNIIVPFWAKSAATLLSLGGSRIIMDEFAEFGPLDVQLPRERDDNLFPDPDDNESALIDEISLETIEKRSHQLFHQMFFSIYTNELIPINKNDLANDLMTYLSKFYEPIIKQINPYKIGDKKRKLDIGIQYARRILSQYNPHISQTDRNKFIDFIVNECPDHGYVVDYDLVKKSLPNLHISESKELDNDFPGYSVKLKDISLYLLNANHQKESFVGFVDLSDNIKETESVITSNTDNPVERTNINTEERTEFVNLNSQNNGKYTEQGS